ncbi:MAG: NAD-dependent epimerase/dehydratase family protein [Caulobacteraceae bacterium]
MTARKTVLIIGATGAFGAHAAVALIARGWTVRALARDPGKAREKLGAAMPVDIIGGDALNEAEVVAAATGARIIVHAANPPAYRNWAGTVLPMLSNSIAAARASGARIILPGSVYNFAADAGPSIAEHAPQEPTTHKGDIRVAAERALEAAAGEGVRSLILRAGDFFGPGAGSAFFNHLLVRRGSRALVFLVPGPRRIDHAFAYLPDLAEAMARLADREEALEPFARFHFAGHFVSTAEVIGCVRQALGASTFRTLPFPWTLAGVLGLFDETLRELTEMRYLWEKPIGLDGSALEAFVGPLRSTPLQAAIAATLEDLLGGAEKRDARGGGSWTSSDWERPASRSHASASAA